ncbi:MAG: maleylacetoacetate isomerase [Achromobacter pulmonis]|uniref:maleylacetoacetate isomerase n=1 Tax=Achromobacter TaxID=222 RepID=UPI0012CBB808|nr:maleylacetoacetate isomerase [Achromobacter pulmonis]MCF7766190.1 maleylacetoacetate isomerase [Achromobacter pulmonis]MPT25345.1 maleylacetoacetate isomerase [Achromobacter sp.]
MQLYSYFRSSAAYRVRIALNLKGLPYEYLAVHLLKEGGQQLSADYRKVNPTALVPTLVDGDTVIGQSLAIIEYLEETHPQAPLLPADAAGRARVRDLALGIACDTHPLNNLRVLKYLKHTLGVDEAAKTAWYQHWVRQGLEALEAQLAGSAATGKFCHGDTPTMADLCLVPQVANARRFDCDLGAMPTVVRIDTACRELPAFDAAAPGKQPDAE